MKQQPVIVKLFKKSKQSTMSYERFKREVHILRSVSHQNILEVLDYGVAPDERPFFTTPALEGETLQTHFRNNHFSYRCAIDVAVQLLTGLSVAHSKNIVHRDLKPSNIFLANMPNSNTYLVKILDFGVSKILDWSLPSLTETDVGIGTEKYMAPEQAMNAKNADKRADIYSIGLILYELFCNTSPFTSENGKETPFNPVTPRPFRSPIFYNAKLSTSVAEVIMKSLSRTPSHRYVDASEMLLALNTAVSTPGSIDLETLNTKGTHAHIPVLKRKSLREMFNVKRK
ncbi:MAG: serine/threonine protein kinase [Deltaproteobacteria bacterium]|nr:serine/threonine protein kinase [Deltaproteobacteria bacterium]